MTVESRSFPEKFAIRVATMFPNNGVGRSPLREVSGGLNSLIFGAGGAPSPSASSPANPMWGGGNSSCSSATATFKSHQPTSYSAYSSLPSCGASAQTSMDLLQAKVEHLERERVELSLQLHQQSEKDRSKKIQMERMEVSLKSNEREKEVLTKALEDAQATAKATKDEKEQLIAEASKLNEQIEAQNTAASETRSLWTKMTAASRELKRLEEDATKLRQEKLTISNEKSVLATAMDGLREANAKQMEEMTMLRLEIEGQRRTFADAKKALEGEMSCLKAEQSASQAALEEALAVHEQEQTAFESERTAMAEEMAELRRQVEAGGRRKVPGEEVDEDDVEGLEHQDALLLIDQLKKKLLQSELKRKQLHNTLQELRGNIRVFVRCRPFLRGDGEEFEASSSGTAVADPDLGGCVRFHKDGSSVSLVGAARSNNQIFTFDQVFKCNSSQEEVYREVSELVQSALDGYKVCIFSYGQTGSGKTHTMSGDREGGMRGIIPRAVEQIVEQVLRMRADGWEVTVNASMLEIYNEELRDLLSQDKAASKDKLKVSNLQGFVTVAGLTSLELDTHDLRSGTRHLEQLLERANKSRMTACTAMNERSSRSHALFMLDVTARHSDGTTFLRGGLRLCDLAGSERLDRTGTATDATRLKETVNINKSLSCLADVFMALGNKSPHVPYRNSKLTMVLQDCLSGDGKALMFVNVSPTHASCQESLCSLRFASQVSQVELGKATKNVFNVMPAQLAPPPPASTSSSSALVSDPAAISAPTSRATRTGRTVAGPSRATRQAPNHVLPTLDEESAESLPEVPTRVPLADSSLPTFSRSAAGSGPPNCAAIRGSARAVSGAKRSAAVLTAPSLAVTAVGPLPPTAPQEGTAGGPPSKRSRQSILVSAAPLAGTVPKSGTWR